MSPPRGPAWPPTPEPAAPSWRSRSSRSSRLSLRSRLALLVAAAVALAVALVSAFAFLAVRAQLLDQVDEDLADRARRSDRVDPGFVARLDSFSRQGEAVSREMLQLLDGADGALAAGVEADRIPIREPDRQVARSRRWSG